MAAEEVDRVTALALEIAHASAIVQSERVELGPPVTSQGSYQTAIQIDPFDVSMEDKLGVLFAADEEMRRAEESLRVRRGGMTFIRVWYTRLVHPRDCVVTGMTRDGVFMIRDGELAYPVKNLRFTQSYVQALAEVEAVGQQSLLLVNDYTGFATSVPALKVSRFNFTGSTA